MSDFVFGYGSLVEPADSAHPAELTGARRAWTVAMDNTVDLPGYKHYLDVEGSRPAVCVAFLDLVDDPASTVNGVCRPVDPADLMALDLRERQYDRVDVTHRVTPAPGRIWTYVGRADARRRADRARATGTLRVGRVYLDTVTAAFDRLGPDQRAAFDAGTDPAGVPVVDLRRVDTP